MVMGRGVSTSRRPSPALSLGIDQPVEVGELAGSQRGDRITNTGDDRLRWRCSRRRGHRCDGSRRCGQVTIEGPLVEEPERATQAGVTLVYLPDQLTDGSLDTGERVGAQDLGELGAVVHPLQPSPLHRTHQRRQHGVEIAVRPSRGIRDIRARPAKFEQGRRSVFLLVFLCFSRHLAGSATSSARSARGIREPGLKLNHPRLGQRQIAVGGQQRGLVVFDEDRVAS